MDKMVTMKKARNMRARKRAGATIKYGFRVLNLVAKISLVVSMLIGLNMVSAKLASYLVEFTQEVYHLSVYAILLVSIMLVYLRGSEFVKKESII